MRQLYTDRIHKEGETLIRQLKDPMLTRLPLADNIPLELRQFPQWVVQKNKTPFQPGTQFGAKAGEPSTWTTFDKAYEALQIGGYDGLGFEFNDNGIIGVDLDHVVNTETGELVDWAADIGYQLNIFTEYSPS